MGIRSSGHLRYTLLAQVFKERMRGIVHGHTHPVRLVALAPGDVIGVHR